MIDPSALCHKCGATLATPSAERAPLCDDCASDRSASRKRNKAREARRAQRANARAWRAGAEGRYTASDIAALRRQQGNRCTYCGARLRRGADAVDHMMPLSRGGRSDLSNLQLLCRPCNTAKGTRSHHEYLATL